MDNFWCNSVIEPLSGFPHRRDLLGMLYLGMWLLMKYGVFKKSFHCVFHNVA